MKRSLVPSPLPGERAGCGRSCRDSLRPERCSLRPSPKPSLPGTSISSSLTLPAASCSVTTMSEAMLAWPGLSAGGSRSTAGARQPQPPAQQRGRGEGELLETRGGVEGAMASSWPCCGVEVCLQAQGGLARLSGKQDFLQVIALQIDLFIP